MINFEDLSFKNVDKLVYSCDINKYYIVNIDENVFFYSKKIVIKK